MTMQSQTLDELPMRGNDKLRTRDRRAAWVMFWCCIAFFLTNLLLCVELHSAYGTIGTLSAELRKLGYEKGTP